MNINVFLISYLITISHFYGVGLTRHCIIILFLIIQESPIVNTNDIGSAMKTRIWRDINLNLTQSAFLTLLQTMER